MKSFVPIKCQLHPEEAAKLYKGQQESMCEVGMRYHGSSLSLAREQFDRRQEILVQQQHCGGNTLTVFRDKLEPNCKYLQMCSFSVFIPQCVVCVYVSVCALAHNDVVLKTNNFTIKFCIFYLYYYYHHHYRH